MPNFPQDYSLLESLAHDGILLVVDVNDTTQSASGTLKKVSIGALLSRRAEVPESNDSPGNVGDVAYDANYRYDYVGDGVDDHQWLKFPAVNQF